MPPSLLTVAEPELGASLVFASAGFIIRAKLVWHFLNRNLSLLPFLLSLWVASAFFGIAIGTTTEPPNRIDFQFFLDGARVGGRRQDDPRPADPWSHKL